MLQSGPATTTDLSVSASLLVRWLGEPPLAVLQAFASAPDLRNSQVQIVCAAASQVELLWTNAKQDDIQPLLDFALLFKDLFSLNQSSGDAYLHFGSVTLVDYSMQEGQRGLMLVGKPQRPPLSDVANAGFAVYASLSVAESPVGMVVSVKEQNEWVSIIERPGRDKVDDSHGSAAIDAMDPNKLSLRDQLVITTTLPASTPQQRAIAESVISSVIQSFSNESLYFDVLSYDDRIDVVGSGIDWQLCSSAVLGCALQAIERLQWLGAQGYVRVTKRTVHAITLATLDHLTAASFFTPLLASPAPKDSKSVWIDADVHTLMAERFRSDQDLLHLSNSDGGYWVHERNNERLGRLQAQSKLLPEVGRIERRVGQYLEGDTENLLVWCNAHRGTVADRLLTKLTDDLSARGCQMLVYDLVAIRNLPELAADISAKSPFGNYVWVFKNSTAAKQNVLDWLHQVLLSGQRLCVLVLGSSNYVRMRVSPRSLAWAETWWIEDVDLVTGPQRGSVATNPKEYPIADASIGILQMVGALESLLMDDAQDLHVQLFGADLSDEVIDMALASGQLRMRESASSKSVAIEHLADALMPIELNPNVRFRCLLAWSSHVFGRTHSYGECIRATRYVLGLKNADIDGELSLETVSVQMDSAVQQFTADATLEGEYEWLNEMRSLFKNTSAGQVEYSELTVSHHSLALCAEKLNLAVEAMLSQRYQDAQSYADNARTLARTDGTIINAKIDLVMAYILIATGDFGGAVSPVRHIIKSATQLFATHEVAPSWLLFSATMNLPETLLLEQRSVTVRHWLTQPSSLQHANRVDDFAGAVFIQQLGARLIAAQEPVYLKRKFAMLKLKKLHRSSTTAPERIEPVLAEFERYLQALTGSPK